MHWHQRNPEAWWRKHLERSYGITPEEWQQILDRQDGRCAICGTDSPGGRHGRFNVDHDHQTGRVRGLLCHRCNVAMGHLDDDVERLRRAVQYLQAGGTP